jgi:hypothetical protein
MAGEYSMTLSTGIFTIDSWHAGTQLQTTMAQSMSGNRIVIALLAAILILATVDLLECQNGRLNSESHMLAYHKSEKTTAVRGRQSNVTYVPAPIEAYIIDHAKGFGWEETKKLTSTCQIWYDPQSTPMHKELQAFVEELDEFNRRVEKHPLVPDFRFLLKNSNRTQDDICALADLDPKGLLGIFKGGQLSLTRSGLVEPLLPPLRHPRFCVDGGDVGPQDFGGGVTLAKSKANYGWLMDLGYIVHDFGVLCRQQTITSRNIFVDMGASLNFHPGDLNKNPPIYLMETFRRFGFPFDHIYAFEITKIPPEDVYAKLPEYYRHSYHWINLGVSPDLKSAQNPLQILLNNFNEEDMVVIKLDIDTPAVEMAMVMQIVEDPRYETLIDHFYFEQHVYMSELAPSWGTMDDSVANSLRLFQTLRKKGIAAHYWP